MTRLIAAVGLLVIAGACVAILAQEFDLPKAVGVVAFTLFISGGGAFAVIAVAMLIYMLIMGD